MEPLVKVFVPVSHFSLDDFQNLNFFSRFQFLFFSKPVVKKLFCRSVFFQTIHLISFFFFCGESFFLYAQRGKLEKHSDASADVGSSVTGFFPEN
jgi:hypothetical protein